jgi:hypothetical protein
MVVPGCEISLMLLGLVHQMGINPKRVSSTKGGEYKSPCPSCGGKDRFTIQPARDYKEGNINRLVHPVEGRIDSLYSQLEIIMFAGNAIVVAIPFNSAVIF